MTDSAASRDPAAAGPGRVTPGLVLELVLLDGEPLSGTVGLAGRASRVSFHGWIDLMTAITRFRSADDDPA